MSIPYTYEIIKVDPAAKAMEIVYTSPGHQTMHIGARMPYAGEALDAVVQMFAPVSYWLEQGYAVEAVAEGAIGAFVPPSPPPPPVVTLDSVKAEKLAEIAAWRYKREISGVILNGAVVKTDRESQATISSAYSSIRDGLIASVDWKMADGSFVTIGLLQITAIAQAVAQHVQHLFTEEKGLAGRVYAAGTIEEVRAIDPTAMTADSFGTIASTTL